VVVAKGRRKSLTSRLVSGQHCHPRHPFTLDDRLLPSENPSLMMDGDSGDDVVEVFDMESQTWSDQLQRTPADTPEFRATVENPTVLVAHGYVNTAMLSKATDDDDDDDDAVPVPRLPKIPRDLDLEREQEEAELGKWFDEVTAIKQDYLANLETEISRLNKNYETGGAEKQV